MVPPPVPAYWDELGLSNPRDETGTTDWDETGTKGGVRMKENFFLYIQLRAFPHMSAFSRGLSVGRISSTFAVPVPGSVPGRSQVLRKLGIVAGCGNRCTGLR
jgi:hypothetical protein